MSTLVDPALADRLISAMREFAESTDPNRVMGLTQEHAKALVERLIPPAEVVRYGFSSGNHAWGTDGGSMYEDPEGEWVRYEDHAAAFARVKTAGRALISIGAEAAVEAADSAEGWKERAEEAKAALAAARAVMVDEDDYPVVGRLREVVARSATGPRLPLVVVEELSNIASEFHRALSAEVAARKDAETALAASEAKRKEAEGVLRAYERWEADLIEDDRAWMVGDGMFVPQDRYDRMIEIQAARNAALTPDAGTARSDGEGK